MTRNSHPSAPSDAARARADSQGHRSLRLLKWLREELVGVLPAIVYFFVAFNILILNDRLILWEHGIRFTDFMRPAIASLVVAKILVLVNLLPFINAFPNKPLIWNTMWKTLIYWIFSIGLQIMESILELAFKYKSLSAAFQGTMSEIPSPRFLVVQMWLFVLLLMFVALQEFVRALGPGKVREMFFGR